MNDDGEDGCLGADEIAGLLDGRVADTVRDRMLAHVSSCGRCAAEFQRLSGDWSLGHLADLGRKQADVDTLALRERLAASPPR